MRTLLPLCLLATVVHTLPNKTKDSTAQINLHAPDEENREYWEKDSEEALTRRLETKQNLGEAKNLLMFLGDGMSVATVSAARIYSGQRDGGPGEESSLSFEHFPNLALSKTYCVDSQVADSACSASAYLCGIKGNLGTLGVTARVKRGDCSAVDDTTRLSSLLAWAQARGKSTGIVTTTRVTHASPAGSYAQTADRDWESDADVLAAGLDPAKCQDIASQLVLNSPGRGINVILGGGRRELLPANNGTEEEEGRRVDGVNLVEEWRRNRGEGGSGKRREYVHDRDALLAVDTAATDHLLGLFAPSHMDYNLGRDAGKQPSLAEMTRVALEILSRNPRGFFLFVEGGRIDHGHHETMARRALDETVEFAESVKVAEGMTEPSETLTVVTADHSHTMSFSGYPGRGQPILSTAGVSDVDGLPYTTLSYANGPGYRSLDGDGHRHNVLHDNTEDMNYHFPSALPTGKETHGGEDVAVYSRGPWSHLLSGVLQQSFIPRVMMFASCLGPQGSRTSCDLLDKP